MEILGPVTVSDICQPMFRSADADAYSFYIAARMRTATRLSFMGGGSGRSSVAQDSTLTFPKKHVFVR